MTASQIYGFELRKTLKYQKVAMCSFIVMQGVLLLVAVVTGSWAATYVSLVVTTIYLISIVVARLRLRKFRAASLQEQRTRIAELKEKRSR